MPGGGGGETNNAKIQVVRFQSEIGNRDAQDKLKWRVR